MHSEALSTLKKLPMSDSRPQPVKLLAPAVKPVGREIDIGKMRLIQDRRSSSIRMVPHV
jgi:hypothetical protein